MNTVQQIQSEIDKHMEAMKGLNEVLVQQVRSLPDNTRAKRVASHCLIVSSKDLGGNWSAEFHDFQKQYELLIEMMVRVPADKALQIMRDAAEKGAIKQDGFYTVKLHPDVIAHLKRLLIFP